ncbi:hypothetical protein [Synechococcus sp. PCC 7502]|nr:hypothetical protein [Synechococcus sp. PCC 7502]
MTILYRRDRYGNKVNGYLSSINSRKFASEFDVLGVSYCDRSERNLA